MRLKIIWPVVIAVYTFIAACSENPVDLQLTVNASLNGSALKQASVVIDNVEVGQTDDGGKFTTTVSKLADQMVQVTVLKDSGEVKAKPWKTEFKMIKKEGDKNPSMALDAKLKNYISITVMYKNEPLPDASIKRGQDVLGKTDSTGKIEYVFDQWPKKGLRLKVDKRGYVAKTLKISGSSGENYDVGMLARAVIQFNAFSDSDGIITPIEGASVYMNKKLLGKTASDGIYTYRHKGKHGHKVKMAMVARGYIPSAWSKTIVLDGKQTYKRNFYSERPRKISTGIYSFVSNASGEDISSVLSKVKKKLSKELFSESKAFVQVPPDNLVKLVKDSKLSLDKIKSKGWSRNRLSRSLDLLVLGSIGRNEDNDYIIEVNFHRKDGKLVMSHVVTASSDSDWRIGRAVSEVVENVLERYPFEGMITAVTEDGYKINLGDDVFPITNSDLFELYAVSKNSTGKITKKTAIGNTEVGRSRSQYTLLELLKNKKVNVGDRVVRLDNAYGKNSDYVYIEVTGGVDSDVRPLPGVNVYAEEKWIGVTDPSGKIKVPARIGRDVDLVLYKHGYKQIQKSVEAETKEQKFAFTMQSYNSKFTVASTPSGASIALDEKNIGTTPMKNPHSVTLGFHTIRLELGGDYRDWEEVVEFNKSEEDRTGNNSIKLYKDYLRLAEISQTNGNVDAAIEAYKKTNIKHPDYAEARHRLAQLYLDDKKDYDSAISEFENVQNIPEVRDLVLKQYAVVYTNLGHAYFAKGDSILDVDKNEAARYFAKSIKALNTAKENSRFFPNDSYDEILHDTYYYIAVAFHNLFKITGKSALQNSADLAWQQYFDFFPIKLESNKEYIVIKGSAQRLWDELKMESGA